MLLDSFEHAEDDVKARLLAEQRVEADGILAATRAAMRDAPELLDDGERDGDRRGARRRSRRRAPAATTSRSAPRSRRSTRVQAVRAARMNRALEQGFRRRATSTRSTRKLSRAKQVERST